MEDYLEDEDVTPEYSPLNQYLSSLNLNNNEHDSLKTSNQTKKISFSMLYECHIVFILTIALKTNILNEFDEKYLHYLIESRQIYWKYIKSNKLLKSRFIKLICLISFFQIYIIFGGLTAAFSVLTLFLSYIFLLVVCGFLLRRLITGFFKNLSTISNQSRQVILFIQEILSLNQGYSKVVHLTDNSLYDCSKSFNEEFLENFTNQIFSILFDLYSDMENINKIFSKRIKETESIIDELPWIDDNSETFLEIDIKNVNCRQPMSQLKNLHNLIQYQFAELIKMIVLISYFVRNHPDWFLLFQLFKLLRRFRLYHEQLVKCKDLLQIQTKSNLSRSNYQGNDLNKSSGDKFKAFRNTIGRLELHLYEMSEFSTQLTKHVNAVQSLTNDSVTSQLQFMDKSKKHVDGIENCWKLLYEELNEILSGDSKTTPNTPLEQMKGTKPTEQIEDINEPMIIDAYPEIVDEVIEGIPEELDNLVENHFSNQEIDTFEERYCSNAKALLNELESVMEVRAEDWKKREKLALKRRAAEGKFVFDKELQFNKKVNGCDLESESQIMNNNNNNNVKTTDVELDTDEFELDFRMSLGEMILKQRHTMMFDSIREGAAEECFGD